MRTVDEMHALAEARALTRPTLLPARPSWADVHAAFAHIEARSHGSTHVEAVHGRVAVEVLLHPDNLEML